MGLSMSTNLKLYDFQQGAVDKLFDVRSVLNADDMGLGKTVTTIVLDQERRKAWKYNTPPKTLIVCPLSVVSSWEDHLADWSPELSVFAIDNTQPEGFSLALSFGSYDVYIIHHQGMWRITSIANYPWFHLIIDECHVLQNPYSSLTEGAKKIPAFYKTGLSGTPGWHKPDDFWSVLNWLYPKFWDSYERYKEQCKNGEISYIQQQIEPFTVRRKKEDILKDLPPIKMFELGVDLYDIQRRAYDDMVVQLKAWIGKNRDQQVVTPNALSKLIRLQQFALAYAEIVDDQVNLMLPSSKLDQAADLINKTTEQVVVFSQFSRAINLLYKHLQNKGVSVGIYTGSVKKRERDDLVNRFQDGQVQVFAATNKAGGVGLNLTAASRVIRLDWDWVGALNKQGIDRVHRIGQTKPVKVVDLVASNTIDKVRLNKIDLNWKIIQSMLG